MSGADQPGLQKVYSSVGAVSSVRAMIDAQLQQIDLEEQEGEKKIIDKLKGVKKKEESSTEFDDFSTIKEFDILSMPRNSVVLVIASRRSGKSFVTQHILEQYHKAKHFDSGFMFSKTNSGFEKSIPQTYRFSDLEHLPKIVDMMVRVKRHNKKAKKRDQVSSNIFLLLDDMVGSGGLSAEMRKDPILNKISVNGRHLDFNQKSSILTILLSQIYTGLSPQIRLNADYILVPKISSRRERESIVNSFMTHLSGREGLKRAYKLFDDIVNEKDFQFLVINTTGQNKRNFSDYIFKIRAPPKLEDIRLVGDDDDWRHNNFKIIF